MWSPIRTIEPQRAKPDRIRADHTQRGLGHIRTAAPLAVDGKVDAQPLYLSRLAVGGSSHNVVFVATEHGSLYAFDADSGAVLWQVLVEERRNNQRRPGLHSSHSRDWHHLDAGHRPQRRRARHDLCGRDVHGGGSGLSSASACTGCRHRRGIVERSHGNQRVGRTRGGTSTFDARATRNALRCCCPHGTLYFSFTSHCDGAPYSGWIMSYAQNTLAAKAVLNIGPNSSSGPAIWMAGGGPAADQSGNVYLLTANGAFETTLDAQWLPEQDRISATPS